MTRLLKCNSYGPHLDSPVHGVQRTQQEFNGKHAFFYRNQQLSAEGGLFLNFRRFQPEVVLNQK